jgi:hypothetical protein
MENRSPFHAERKTATSSCSADFEIDRVFLIFRANRVFLINLFKLVSCYSRFTRFDLNSPSGLEIGAGGQWSVVRGQLNLKEVFEKMLFAVVIVFRAFRVFRGYFFATNDTNSVGTRASLPA